MPNRLAPRLASTAVAASLSLLLAVPPAFAGDDTGPAGTIAPTVELPGREVNRLQTASTDGTRPAAVQAPGADPALAAKVSSLMRDSRINGTGDVTGTLVADAASNQEIYTRNAWKAVTPASNLKVVTAAAAMSMLGPNHRFSTTVYRRGAASNGTLSGDLYLKGFGDFTMRESDLVSLAQQVRAAGIRKVTGRLVYDASFLDNDRYNDYWKTTFFSSYYAPQIAGLTLSPNGDLDVGTIIVNYSPGSVGRAAKLSVTPAAAAKYVKLVNKTTTGSRGTGDTISIKRTSGTNTITVRGRVASGRAADRGWVTVSNPAGYAAHVFRRALSDRGVSVSGATASGLTPASGVQVARDTSVPLSQILTPFLKLSNNGHAEHLVKTLGRIGNRPGSWSAGTARIRAWLPATGAPSEGIVLRDGSGLSYQNRVTARAMVRVLTYARRQPWGTTFRDALPVAGNPDRWVGGTLRNRMRGTRAAYNLRGKTGTLNGATALSGYVTGADGRSYAFSMISNYRGTSPRPVEDKLGVLLAGWRRQA